MSAKYPNVPNVEGVPAIARPDALLSAIRIGTNDAITSGEQALSQLGAGDTSGALSSLNDSLASATSAVEPAEEVFSTGSEIVSGVNSAVANASSAITALGSGDLNGAVASAERMVDAAESAYSSVMDVIDPQAETVETGSDDEAEADLMNQWGMYTQEGELAAPADTVIAFENVLDARISDYPVENGGFASYNKVITPYEIRVIMTCGGAVEDRQDFLKAIQDAWQSTTLYNFVTPECVYLDVNVTGVRQQRAPDRGNGLLALEVVLRKIRQTASLAFTDTKEASGQDTVNQGSVQALATTSSQQYAGAAK